MALLILLVACKRTPKTEPPPDPPPTGTHATGHSVTHLKDDSSSDGGIASDAPGVSIDAARPAFGGDGSPAYRDDEGHVHGPGGGIFMGAGHDCDDSYNHCLREGTWFSVDDVIPGKLFRAVALFQFEDKWWTWRGDEETPIHLYRTEKVSDTTKLHPGDQVIWFSQETDTKKWADSEYDAMTSSRWESAVVAAVNASAKTVLAKGWPDPIAFETARVVVESK